jgi:hypothetical protein
VEIFKKNRACSKQNLVIIRAFRVSLFHKPVTVWKNVWESEYFQGALDTKLSIGRLKKQ